MLTVHWAACKVNETRRGSCKICRQPSVVYISINIRKNKFIAYMYIYIPFNQSHDENFYISAKIETVKHLRAFFLLTEEQHQ